MLSMSGLIGGKTGLGASQNPTGTFMTRIPWDLEHPTNSSNAVDDDSVVGHRHLLIRLADRTAEGRAYVAESAPDFFREREIVALENVPQGMRCAAKHLMAARFQRKCPIGANPAWHCTHNV
jgi:hypothetical protein